jgi:hypothetical protein
MADSVLLYVSPAVCLSIMRTEIFLNHQYYTARKVIPFICLMQDQGKIVSTLPVLHAIPLRRNGHLTKHE